MNYCGILSDHYSSVPEYYNLKCFTILLIFLSNVAYTWCDINPTLFVCVLSAYEYILTQPFILIYCFAYIACSSTKYIISCYSYSYSIPCCSYFKQRYLIKHYTSYLIYLLEDTKNNIFYRYCADFVGEASLGSSR